MQHSSARTQSFGSAQAHSRSPLRASVSGSAAAATAAAGIAGGPESGNGSPAARGSDSFHQQQRRRRSSSRHIGSTSASTSSFSRPVLTSRPVLLWTHEPPNFSRDELVLNPDLIAAFGGVSDGSELLEVSIPKSSSSGNPVSGANDDHTARNVHHRRREHAHSRYPGPGSSAAADAKRRRRDRGIARRSFVFRASQAVGDIDCIDRSATQLQLSMSRNIANVFGLHNRCEVILSKVPLAEHVISHIELYFRDQYLGRADQWRLNGLLEDTCVYVGQRVTLSGCVRATVGRIFINEKKVMSGYVGPQTRAIFRSESAKYNVFIQMAQEMWDFDEDGEIYYEKALSGFLPELIRRWRGANTTHVVSIILFARVFYDESEIHMLQEVSLPLLREEGRLNRWYIDYYKVIVDLESDCDWPRAFTMLKEEFFRFRHDVLLLRRPVSGPAGAPWLEEQHADLLRRDRALLAGTLSTSHEGNILEAINLALNPFDEHYIDRDLNRTGLDLLVLSAGTGHFDVDKSLLRLTTERLIDSGIGFDLVCLTKMPLHSVPLFHFQSHVPPVDTTKNRTPGGGAPAGGKRGTRQSPKRRANTIVPQNPPPDPLYVDAKVGSNLSRQSRSIFSRTALTDFYSIPHWVDCSFYNLQQDAPFRADRFVPRCKMHEIQMLGLMENEISDIAIPYIDFTRIPGVVAATGQGFDRSGSLGSGNIPAFSSSGSGRHSRQTFMLTESFGDVGGLGKREQLRLLREKYDQETFRDLEHVPTVYRPWLVQNEFERTSDAILSTSPAGFNARTSTPKHDPKRSSMDNDKRPPSSSASSSSALHKDVRASRGYRDFIQDSPSLASHCEQPDTTHDAENENGTSWPVSSPLYSPARPHAPSALTRQDSSSNLSIRSKKSSRPSSIYSLSGFGRGVRPLEHLGKAKAMVASSGFKYTAADNTNASTSLADRESSSAVSKAAIDARHASSASGKQSPPKPKSGYSWLWSTLKRSGGGTAAGSQASLSLTPDETPSKGDLSHSSPLQASLRIQALLKGPSARLPANSHHSQTTTPDFEKDWSDTQAAGQRPISIPAQNGENSEDGSRETSTDREASRTGNVDNLRQALEEEEAKARYATLAQVEKQTLVNPCNPKKSLQALSNSQLMRWQHAFPRRLNQHVVKWRSMTTPACLPLTTIYLPSETDLKSQWQEHPYQMSVSSDMTSFLVKRASSTPPALAVLREMVSQRLAQGFQFIVPVAQSSGRQDFAPVLAEAERKQFRLQEPWELFQPGSLASGNPIFLSMTNQIHRILYDRASNCIHVKRFVRRTEYDTTPLDYKCCVWARNLPGYQTVQARFRYPDTAGYNWTYLDALIAGHSEQDELADSTRYWRTRFVVVPSEGSPPSMQGPRGEKLSDEEVRLAGMDRLADLFTRVRWRPRNSGVRGPQRQSAAPTAPLRFIATSLDPAMSLRDDEFVRQLEAAHEEDDRQADLLRQRQRKATGRMTTRVLKDMNKISIVKHMCESPELKINDRLWNRVMYRETFSGADFVTWLCLEFADIVTRGEATEYGQRLLKEGTLQHVHNYHGFLDGHYFYRVHPALLLAVREQDQSWFHGYSTGKTSTTNGDHHLDASKARPHQGEASSSSGAAPSTLNALEKSGGLLSSQLTNKQQQQKGSRKVPMSRSMIIDVDPGRRSDCSEVALLHHDLAHNPANGFNFQIHWLGTTARFIEDLVQSWTRAVERYGLRLIEAPINQIKDVSQHNPFQAPLGISLALHPPSASVLARRLPDHVSATHFFEYALLRRFGFILDQEASEKYLDISKSVIIEYKSRPNHFDLSQFVHRSGVAFVQVLPNNEGFLWLDNRLYNSHHTQHQAQQQQQHGSGGHGAPLRPATQHTSAASPNLGSGAWTGTAQQGGHGHGQSSTTGPSRLSADAVRYEFIDFCSDPERLEAFYRAELERLQAESVQQQSPRPASNMDGHEV